MGDDEGQGEFYGYVGENTLAVLNPLISVEGYVMTPIENGQTTKINMKEFFDSKGDYNNDGKMEWIIKNTDAITRPNSYIVDATNEKDMEFSIKNIDANGKTYYTSYDPYTYGVLIPITNEEGIAMHNKAIEIKNDAGQYNLYNHNCNQVAQTILSAGGKDFAPNTFDWFDTRPNSVRDNLVNNIKGNVSSALELNIANYLDNKYVINSNSEYVYGNIGELKNITSMLNENKYNEKWNFVFDNLPNVNINCK